MFLIYFLKVNLQLDVFCISEKISFLEVQIKSMHLFKTIVFYMIFHDKNLLSSLKRGYNLQNGLYLSRYVPSRNTMSEVLVFYQCLGFGWINIVFRSYIYM